MHIPKSGKLKLDQMPLFRQPSRKPLILARAIVLGSLLPQTDDAEKDLEIFEKLMAFDEVGLARRALVQNTLKPKDIAVCINLENPWNFFKHNVKEGDPLFVEIADWIFPLDIDQERVTIRWRQDIGEQDKIELFRKALNTFPSYEDKAELCKRPEDLE